MPQDETGQALTAVPFGHVFGAREDWTIANDRRRLSTHLPYVR